MISKTALRKTMREKRRALPDTEMRERSLAAQRFILASNVWKNASSVGLFKAVHSEICTDSLFEEAWNARKKIFLPYMLPAPPAGIMHFLPCGSGQALVANQYGILEPTPEVCPLPPEGDWIPDLVIVPGLAFDRVGHRLGSGGGYYDRVFAKESMCNSVRIGFAYAFQIVDAVPVEEWDIAMHAVATDEGLVWL